MTGRRSNVRRQRKRERKEERRNERTENTKGNAITNKKCNGRDIHKRYKLKNKL
jgi:hypothetical protein